MDVILPSDCGNAPRIGIVSEIVTRWAAGDTAALEAWLADDARWILAGRGTWGGGEAARGAAPPFVPERLELHAVITHGRHAACDGVIEAGGDRYAFSHAIRFASTAKTAKIAEIRTYGVAD